MSVSSIEAERPLINVLSIPMTQRLTSLCSFIKNQSTNSTMNIITKHISVIVLFRSYLTAHYFADLLDFHYERFSNGSKPKIYRYYMKGDEARRLRLIRSWCSQSSQRWSVRTSGGNECAPIHLLFCHEELIPKMMNQLKDLKNQLRLDWIYYFDLPTCPKV